MIAVFLCDVTGHMAQPWAEAGVECYCVDIQHSVRRPRYEGGIHFVYGDVRSWVPPKRPLFVGAWPPCTDTTRSGAQDHRTKGGMALRDALEIFECCRQAAAWSGAPYFIENPVGFLSKIPHIGTPDHYFHPTDYAGYLQDPDEDRYLKRTCLWTGNGFIMPEPKHLEPLDLAKIHQMGESKARADKRSATPRGFARATFEANKGVLDANR